MLRISAIEEDHDTLTLRLDGTITPASIGELEEACMRHRQQSDKTLLLDMTGITFVENRSLEPLARLRGERLRFIRCSSFIEALLESEKHD